MEIIIMINALISESLSSLNFGAKARKRQKLGKNKKIKNTHRKNAEKIDKILIVRGVIESNVIQMFSTSSNFFYLETIFVLTMSGDWEIILK